MFKFISSFVAAFVIGAFASVVLAGVNVEVAVAQGNSQPKTQQAKTEQKAASYKYTAQVGDTYSQFARKAVQTYGKKNKINLSQAQIIFAETMLTQTAGSPVLNLGEERSVAEADVKSAVEKAAKLGEVQKAAWAVYAVGVNFNTDRVGQK